MTQVKFNNEKWWVLLNGTWVEIKEKDWKKIWLYVWYNSSNPYALDWQPTPDQIYSLPNEVEFEIDGECDTMPIGCYCDEEHIDKSDCFRLKKKVAHLKESEPIQSTQITKPMTICNGKINSGGICELCCQPAQSSYGYCGRMIEESEPKKEPAESHNSKIIDDLIGNEENRIKLIIISELELKLKPQYMNDIFTWSQIKKALL